jgi:hypothetical protein
MKKVLASKIITLIMENQYSLLAHQILKGSGKYCGKKGMILFSLNLCPSPKTMRLTQI